MTKITGGTRVAPGVQSARRSGLWPKLTVGMLVAAMTAFSLAGCDQSGTSTRITSLQLNLSSLNWGDSLPASVAASAPMSARLQPAIVRGPGSTATTTDVLTLIIGAVVITFQDTPLGLDTPITDALKNSLKNDVINSVKYFQLVHLPTTTDTVEFDAPPATAGHWQIAVIGLSNSINVLQDLSDTINTNPPIYYGFNVDPATGSGVFLTTNTTSGSFDAGTMTMHRACVVTPNFPKGCASFMPTSNTTPQVSDAVEIVQVGFDATGTCRNNTAAPCAPASPQGGVGLPIIVRSGATTPCTTTAAVSRCNATAAAQALRTGWPQAYAGTAGTRVVIKTTHALSGNQPAACSALSANSDAALLLLAAGGYSATNSASGNAASQLVANCAEDAVFSAGGALTTPGTLAGTEDYPMVF